MARFSIGTKKGRELPEAEAFEKHAKDKIKPSKADTAVPKVEAKREHDKGKRTK